MKRIDIWGFSGDHRCRIKTRFSKTEDNGKSEAHATKKKRIDFAVKAVLGS